MSISSIGLPPVSAFGTVPATTTGNGVAVAQTTDSGIARTAVTLSTNAGVIATLGGTSTAALTYNAAGLLNSISRAGTAPTPIPTPQPGTNTQAFALQLLDKGIIGTLASDSVASGIYNGAGVLQSLPSAGLSSHWASVLKTNPGLSANVIADSFNQGIIGTLKVTA